MDDVWFGNITQGDAELASRVTLAMRELYKRRPGMFAYFEGRDALVPGRGQVYHVVGRSPDEPLGYALCDVLATDHQRYPVSYYERVSGRPELVDPQGRLISHVDFSLYPGYQSFVGQGPLVHVALLEVWRRGQGYGSALVNYLQGQPYELLEVTAYGAKRDFFAKQDFVDTTLRTDEPDDPGTVMAWHNPAYRQHWSSLDAKL
ncbi:hypothetical protein GF367_00050 [Candidatus Woesearchaeota archaeon]|nr:hypothetical protein [Candidatus Woesearchaeota archaeon]